MTKTTNCDKIRNFTYIDKQYAVDKPLGAIWSRAHTIFRVWSPVADYITLNLYKDCKEKLPFFTEKLSCENGLWECAVTGNLSGVYYTYSVSIDGTEKETIDIYAKSGGVNGQRGMIYDPSLAEIPFVPFKAVPKDKAIICEAHTRDFSADESGNFSVRGKFSAFTESGVKNRFGDAVGLDYLEELGITHVHLLPIADYASVDEYAYNPEYNWGYDPQNYFFPEGAYSSDPYDGLCRIIEFKSLVNALHKRNIGVVMDVVFNHVYDVEKSSFNAIFPDYYFRHDNSGSLSNGSGCGNEFASERLMARKFIADCLCHWVEEYHVDGFRFDLMGLTDIKTLEYCAKRLKAINPDILLYGEGWTGGASPLPESRRGVISNIERLHDFSMFSDEFRDCVKGSVFSDEECGYINGKPLENAELMKSVLVGGVYHPDNQRENEYCLSDNPLQRINYVECHDNLTFADKLEISMPDSSREERAAVNRLGAALVLLAQGIPFIALGQEFMRSKGGNHNSYNSPDSVNSIKWDMLSENRETADYYKGLIAIRKRFGEFRLRSGKEIRRKVSFSDFGGGAFCMKTGGFILLVNPTDSDTILLIDGEFEVYADYEKADSEPFCVITGSACAKPHSVLLVRQKPLEIL